MKKKFLVGVLLATSLLTACSLETTVREKGQELIEKVASSNSSSQADSGEAAQQAYQPMLEEMKDTWDVLSGFGSNQSLSYAMVDIDQNGQPELLLGSKHGDGSVRVIDLYYLNNGQPTSLLPESAESIQVFEGGQILAYRLNGSKGKVQHYQLSAKGGTAQFVEEKEFQNGQDQALEMFRLENEVPLENLNWVQLTDTKASPESSTTSQKSSGDKEAIAAGDFSSIQGSWMSRTGNQFEISRSKILMENRTYTATRYREVSGNVAWSVLEAQSTGICLCSSRPSSEHTSSIV
ncbi:hypothetical protein JEQ21_07105 [Streptococcus sp. 121]|uniref:hypothetical protein n=1 Tax=Streptococcus sp. 121 TaxID=2797637 RepID=UPI0018F0CDEB|nr:hypothetical protein [Streptococcus sp. 121]MBJ6746223.1 hypothetical protein [Streptococcus sp. 121]